RSIDQTGDPKPCPTCELDLDHAGWSRQGPSVRHNCNRRKLNFASRSTARLHRSAARLATPEMQQVRMNIVPASDFAHGRVGRQALLNNPLLLRRSPTPPPL